MSDNTDASVAYQQAREAFDARWEKVRNAPASGAVQVVETISLDGILDRMLAQVRKLALTCAERGLIDADRRDAILAAADEIKRGVAGIPPEDLVDAMRSIRVTPPPQASKNPSE
jgi:hypothetical protein